MFVLATMKLERLVPVAAALALLASPVAAAGHPDMTGTWAVDAAKSDFGPNPVPTDLVFKITAQGEEFQVHQSGGGQADLDLRFNTSGKEVTNEVPGGTMTSTHRWEGNTLVGAIKFDTGGGTLTFQDRISYSPDGKVMTVSRAISGPMGEGQMKIVMNKK